MGNYTLNPSMTQPIYDPTRPFATPTHSQLQREFGDLMQGDRNHVEISCKIDHWVSTTGKYAPVIARIGVHVECICLP